MARAHHINHFFEVSSLHGTNLDAVFQALVLDVLDQMREDSHGTEVPSTHHIDRIYRIHSMEKMTSEEQEKCSR